MRNLPLFILGIISLVLGVIGAALPILPTTPFILLSAYCFSKSSDKFYFWLIGLPKFGILIQNWNEKGTINKKSKIACFLSISTVIIYFCFFSNILVPIKILLPLILIPVLFFVLTRPQE